MKVCFVAQPEGIREVEVFPTLASKRTDQQAIAEDEGLGQNPLALSSSLLIPNVYGSDGEINEVGDPNDGTSASARALSQHCQFRQSFKARAVSHSSRYADISGVIRRRGASGCGDK